MTKKKQRQPVLTKEKLAGIFDGSHQKEAAKKDVEDIFDEFQDTFQPETKSEAKTAATALACGFWGVGMLMANSAMQKDNELRRKRGLEPLHGKGDFF